VDDLILTKDNKIKTDGRKKAGKANAKSLKYARKLPIKCNDCIYRPKEEMGNGVCTVYKRDGICSIRKDLAKLTDSLDGERNVDKVSIMMQDTFESNYEILKFYEALEHQMGIINPDRIKLLNSLTNMGKIINEMSAKTIKTIEETHTLSDEKKEEISRMVRIEIQESTPD